VNINASPINASSLLESIVFRRFSDFERLYTLLLDVQVQPCGYIIPPLPEKSVYDKLVADDSQFVKDRVSDLERFLVRIGNHKMLRQTHIFYLFLTEKSFDEGKIG
jgi:hypothetical protein